MNQLTHSFSQDSLSVLHGVWLVRLAMHGDDRGSVTELFRESWGLGPDIVQWNIVNTRAGVVRGVHVHLVRHDLLSVLHGRASIGLRDLRRSSPTCGEARLIELRGDQLSVLTVPPGVVHGFYSDEDSVLCSAFSVDWDASDDYGCHWADPHLGIPWPSADARCSEKDAALPSFLDLQALLPEWLQSLTAK